MIERFEKKPQEESMVEIDDVIEEIDDIAYGDFETKKDKYDAFLELREKYKNNKEFKKEIEVDALKGVISSFEKSEDNYKLITEYIDKFNFNENKDLLFDYIAEEVAKVFVMESAENILKKYSIFVDNIDYSEREFELRKKIINTINQKYSFGGFDFLLNELFRDDLGDIFLELTLEYFEDKRIVFIKSLINSFDNFKEIISDKVTDKYREKIISYLNSTETKFNTTFLKKIMQNFDISYDDIKNIVDKAIEKENIPENINESILNKVDDDILEKFNEKLDKKIPEIVNEIIEKNVSFLILTEKTTRLFKVAFQRLFKKLDYKIKVLSIAPDYFKDNDDEKFQKVKDEKIEKLENEIADHKDKKIMVVDEYKYTGKTEEIMKKGLEKIGFLEDNILTKSIEESNILEGNPVLETVYYNKNKIFKSDDEKNNQYGNRLKGEYDDLTNDIGNSAKSYKKTLEDIWRIFDNIDIDKFNKKN